ncbi:MAG TPA: TrmJ/YjtD family RNA methyltransferase [Terriglobales bacterium]|nr:TrmJ/YjtD family RNA methyltransferase [Terriglobales bacterium]
MFDPDHLCVVLVAARNPLNIGASARAMSNFGFSKLRVVNPYSLPFREARSAVGGADLLQQAEECATLAEAVADCSLVVGTSALQHRELRHPVHRLEKAAELIQKALSTGRVALVFGSEKRGLSKEDLSHCHWILRIPTREEHSSMNLGQAVAVCLYELVRSSGDAEKPEHAVTDKTQPATSAGLERLTRVLLQSLEASGYAKQGTAAAAEENVRRLVRRLSLHSEDAELLLGMLRKVLWKLEQQG